MSTEQTSNQPTQDAPSEVADKVQTNGADQDDTSSTEVQGEEQENASPNDGQGEELQTEEKPKKKSGIQRLKERHAREMAAIHREIEALKAQGSKGQREEEKSADLDRPRRPRAEEFETHAEYEAAMDKHFDDLLDYRDRQTAKKSKEAQSKSAYEAQVKSHQERVEKYRAANPDYDTAIEDFIEEHGDVQFSMGLQQAVQESDMGPAVIHELLKKPDELTRINGLSPLAAAREIGKIEERLSAKASAKPEPKTTTKAPAPLKPVAGSSSAPRRSIHDPDLPFADYVRLRREQMRRKA